MKRSPLLWIALAGLGLLVGGCSDQNASDNEAHPSGWVLAHRNDADAGGNADACRTCHGANLGGGSVGVACLDCHADGPPFKIHPSSWGDPLFAHMSFPEGYSWTTCATTACHGSTLRGGHGSGETGPSCFSDDFTDQNGRNAACHGASGPPAPTSHQVADFTAPGAHGALAKGQDTLGAGKLDPATGQLYCRNCHGKPLNDFSGGFVAAPDILDADSACSGCHPEARAHPAKWTRSDGDVTHSTTPEAAWSVGCSLCHRIDAPGAGSLPGAPSCFSANFSNVDGQVITCHDGGPGSAPHPLDGSWYFPAAGQTGHFESTLPCADCHSPLETFCAQCHFGPTGSKTPDANLWTHGRANHAAGAPFDFKNEPSVTAVCTRCHQLANTFTQAPAQTGCTNCHGFAVHAADYLADHRAAALADLLPCRQCHDTPGTVPNFDGYVSGVACTQCHPDALAHPFTAGAFPGWADHSSAGNVPAACAICHSTAIPSSGPSPLSAAPPCAECHADGFVAHAFPFVASHLAAAKADLTVCQRCHSDNPTGGPGSDPRFNVPFPQFSVVGTANNGCESCHVAYTAHPVPWLDHMTAGNIFGACALCHGASLEGGTNAPACTTCHSNAHAVPYPDHGAAALADPTVCELCHGQDLAGEYGPACATCHTLAPLTNAGCTSCHNEPPNGGAPVGNQYANRAGQHAGHLGLPTAGIGCATCHPDPATAQGATQHYADAKLRQAPATVTLSATYQAKTGTLAFQGNGLTGGTCSAVSCHGGQQTPNWLTGTIDVNTQCTACHASGTAQWNSYSSGRHSLHVSFAACTECHNTTNLATNHFTALDTTAMEGPASGTIGGGTTSIPAGGYTPGVTAGTGSCSPSCHGTETW